MVDHHAADMLKQIETMDAKTFDSSIQQTFVTNVIVADSRRVSHPHFCS